jgi:iron(III) transport system permease protein
VAVVMMETINDFGAVDYFAVQTLTTGIFSVWLQAGNIGGAAQLASLSLTLIVVLVLLEKLSRRRSRFYSTARDMRPMRPQRATGHARWLLPVACGLPVLTGFVLPVAVLTGHALDAREWAAPGLLRALAHTLGAGGVAAVLTVTLAVFLVYAARLTARRLPLLLLPVTAIGYAVPGAVLGVGLLYPLAGLDNRAADAVLALTGTDPGLLITGSAGAVVISYIVRFFAIAQGTADAALGRISPSLTMAARSLGRTPSGALREVQVPLVRASLASALLLIFVDCTKELPATLLLRPFGYETLATRVHAKASLENLAEAAPAALMITLVGLAAVALLARANR